MSWIGVKCKRFDRTASCQREPVYASETTYVGVGVSFTLLLIVSWTFRALIMGQVAVTCRRPRELCPASWAVWLCCGAGLFPLMPQQITEGWELTAVAAMLPTLRSWARLEYPNGLRFFQSRRSRRRPSITWLRRRICYRRLAWATGAWAEMSMPITT